MKFLLKLALTLALLVVAAKAILQMPEGKNGALDKMGKTTVREIAHHVDTAFSKLEKTVKELL